MKKRLKRKLLPAFVPALFAAVFAAGTALVLKERAPREPAALAFCGAAYAAVFALAAREPAR